MIGSLCYALEETPESSSKSTGIFSTEVSCILKASFNIPLLILTLKLEDNHTFLFL